MKKLLLILIFLFVSFEVKSKSDDLTGKGLFCKGNLLIEGYLFQESNEVKHFIIFKNSGTMNVLIQPYETTPRDIIIKGVMSNTRINRETLNGCSLVRDIEILMSEVLDVIVKDLESRQKI